MRETGRSSGRAAATTRSSSRSGPSARSSTVNGFGHEGVYRLRNPCGADLQALAGGLALYHKIKSCEDLQLKDALESAVQVLEDGLRLYGPDRLIGSYNGGKDAVVVMHLYRAAMAQYCVETGEAHRVKLIYFENDREFREVETLVEWSTEEYDLDLSRYKMGFVEGLRQRIAEGGGGAFAFVLGTRTGDPNCGTQTSFSPSSRWMPPFMRVNPILNWNYGQVWAFLRTFDLPYCPLYDQGYTSLGNMDDTFPNPLLRRRSTSASSGASRGPSDARQDGSALEDEYLPAFMLSDWTLERAGRGRREVDSLACELRDLDVKRRKVREARSVGLVIIGDEILKAKCADSNSDFAKRRLWDKGIPVKHVAVVPDEVSAIVKEVRRQVQEFDVVITSGGVGPTHDDITIKAVARALNQGIRQNQDMLDRLAHNFGVESAEHLTDAQQKMAMLPELAKLRVAPLDEKGWPILQCENVFILPGVPQFFKSKMSVIADHFLDARPMCRKKIVLSADEFLIVDHLDKAVTAHPSVTFGSYPYFNNPELKTVITLEGENEDEVVAALRELEGAMPKDYVVKVVDDDDLQQPGQGLVSSE